MNYALHVDKLKAGKTVQFRPRGNSMTPIINSGQLVTIAPLTAPVAINDAVLCRVKGKFYVHLIKAIEGDRVLIGNNHHHINGWTLASKVYGKVVKVE